MSWFAVRQGTEPRVSPDGGELVFAGELPPGATMIQCLRMAWEEARSEARGTYEAWHREGGHDAYVIYRAAQDRADTAQDALARVVCVAA
jgi:hypothetical protein